MKVKYAILSGIFASLASAFGKLSGLPTLKVFIIRLMFFAMMVICNGGVWTFFVKALQESDTTLAVTLISSASNYILSAIIGSFIFNEVTTLLWWCGMSFIILGLLLVLDDQKLGTN